MVTAIIFAVTIFYKFYLYELLIQCHLVKVFNVPSEHFAGRNNFILKVRAAGVICAMPGASTKRSDGTLKAFQFTAPHNALNRGTIAAA
ncbi:MAG: hypothetical protein ABJB86_17445 [Bacteroidota bacterium]